MTVDEKNYHFHRMQKLQKSPKAENPPNGLGFCSLGLEVQLLGNGYVSITTGRGIWRQGERGGEVVVFILVGNLRPDELTQRINH